MIKLSMLDTHTSKWRIDDVFTEIWLQKLLFDVMRSDVKRFRKTLGNILN